MTRYLDRPRLGLPSLVGQLLNFAFLVGKLVEVIISRDEIEFRWFELPRGGSFRSWRKEILRWPLERWIRRSGRLSLSRPP